MAGFLTKGAAPLGCKQARAKRGRALQANDRSAVDEASAEFYEATSGLLLIIVNCTKTNVWCGHINYGPLAQLVSLRRKRLPVAGF